MGGIRPNLLLCRGIGTALVFNTANIGYVDPVVFEKPVKGGIMSKLKARDIMSKDVVWISDDMEVSQATKLFVDEMISGAPVVDEEGAMVGVVSFRDFARSDVVEGRLSAEGSEPSTTFFQESWDLPLTREEADSFHLEKNAELLVRDVMTPTLFYVDVDASVQDVAEMMLKGRVHRMVVLEDQELAGMITTMDMLKVVCAG